jgi:hypothetical protein
MMKVLQLTALDGSKWNIPATVIADSFRAHYGPDEEPDDGDLIEWAGNDMNWSDVKAHAVQVKGADALDMQDSWNEGDFEITDAPDVAARAAAVVEVSKQAFACTRCGASCVAGEKLDCDRGPCPMELVGDDDEIALVMPVPLDADELAALKLRLAAARCATGELDTAIEPFAHINLMPDHIDALALTVKVADKVTSKDYLDLYYAMREDAATILAGVQAGDHGDAIIAAFGERAARMAILKAAGLSE